MASDDKYLSCVYLPPVHNALLLQDWGSSSTRSHWALLTLREGMNITAVQLAHIPTFHSFLMSNECGISAPHWSLLTRVGYWWSRVVPGPSSSGSTVLLFPDWGWVAQGLKSPVGPTSTILAKESEELLTSTKQVLEDRLSSTILTPSLFFGHTV